MAFEQRPKRSNVAAIKSWSKTSHKEGATLAPVALRPEQAAAVHELNIPLVMLNQDSKPWDVIP